MGAGEPAWPGSAWWSGPGLCPRVYVLRRRRWPRRGAAPGRCRPPARCRRAGRARPDHSGLFEGVGTGARELLDALAAGDAIDMVLRSEGG